jgi:hypothetical protein
MIFHTGSHGVSTSMPISADVGCHCSQTYVRSSLTNLESIRAMPMKYVKYTTRVITWAYSKAKSEEIWERSKGEENHRWIKKHVLGGWATTAPKECGRYSMCSCGNQMLGLGSKMPSVEIPSMSFQIVRDAHCNCYVFSVSLRSLRMLRRKKGPPVYMQWFKGKSDPNGFYRTYSGFSWFTPSKYGGLKTAFLSSRVNFPETSGRQVGSNSPNLACVCSTKSCSMPDSCRVSSWSAKNEKSPLVGWLTVCYCFNDHRKFVDLPSYKIYKMGDLFPVRKLSRFGEKAQF